MSGNQNRQIFRQYVEAFNAGDIDGWASLLSDDFRLIGMGMPKSGIDHDIGRDDLVANMQKYRHLFRQTIFLTIDNVICEGDQLAAQVHSHAILTNGTPYANNYAFIVRFRDGKITAMSEYCCTFTVRTELRETGVGIGIEAASSCKVSPG